MENITKEQAADRIALFANEGRLVQESWHSKDEYGRHLACILGSIDESISGPDDCPASVMPAWMAQLLPTLFDGVRADTSISYGKRFAAALRTGNTDDTVLRRFLVRSIEFSVAEARKSCADEDYWPAIEKSCGNVSDLLIAGAKSGSDEMSAARSAAESAAWSAAWSAARSAAESAARSAAESAAWSAARSAAESAARSAAESAAWSAAESAAWSAAESVARSVAYEHLFNALIEEMERA